MIILPVMNITVSGQLPEWTRSRKTQSRMSTYLVTEVFYTQAW